MARPKKARLEGEEFATPAEGDVDAISAGVAAFKARFPEEWEALRLCPLQHGLETMIEKLSS